MLYLELWYFLVLCVYSVASSKEYPTVLDAGSGCVSMISSDIDTTLSAHFIKSAISSIMSYRPSSIFSLLQNTLLATPSITPFNSKSYSLLARSDLKMPRMSL